MAYIADPTHLDDALVAVLHQATQVANDAKAGSLMAHLTSVPALERAVQTLLREARLHRSEVETARVRHLS